MKSSTVTIISITLLAAAGAYWYFFMQAGNQPPLTESSLLQNPAQTRFQMLVNQLQPISFDTEVLSDPKFTSLVSLATPVVPESVGRLDPFAPFSGRGRQ